MKKNHSDDIFKKIAETYTEYSGQQLQNELRSQLPLTTSHLDDLVTKRVRTLKLRKFTKIAGIIAACLALVLIIPAVYRQQDLPHQNSTSQKMEENNVSNVETNLIPLAFTPPDNYNISDTKEDNGISIYYLSNTLQDDVILQMESMDTATPAFEVLKALEIKGNQAYALATADYKIVSFIHDNILYTLTCQHDINTLIELSENIF